MKAKLGTMYCIAYYYGDGECYLAADFTSRKEAEERLAEYKQQSTAPGEIILVEVKHTHIV